MPPFANAVSIVTGAASGLGAALTRELIARGALVCLADLDEDGLIRSAADLDPTRILLAPTDVTEEAAVAALVARTLAWRGRVDFLFNNAGIGGTLPIHAATTAHWKRIVDFNLWGVIHGITAVLPVMRRQSSGHIVNVASISGLVPIPGQALYNTTKFAVVGLSESLRHEVAADGIRVSVLCPDAFASAIWGKPILGATADIAPPHHAAPVEEIAAETLDAIGRGEGIIVTPARARDTWRRYREDPAEADGTLADIAGKRRTPANNARQS